MQDNRQRWPHYLIVAHRIRNDQYVCVSSGGIIKELYLTFPRYGIGIDAPDNSVIIADSREVHGVTPIRGNGERFSCVAYCDNRLGLQEIREEDKALQRKKVETLKTFFHNRYKSIT